MLLYPGLGCRSEASTYSIASNKQPDAAYSDEGNTLSVLDFRSQTFSTLFSCRVLAMLATIQFRLHASCISMFIKIPLIPRFSPSLVSGSGSIQTARFLYEHVDKNSLMPRFSPTLVSLFRRRLCHVSLHNSSLRDLEAATIRSRAERNAHQSVPS